LFIGNKKCRIYAACGVSQTPMYDLFMRGEISADAVVTYAQDPVAMNRKVNFEI